MAFAGTHVLSMGVRDDGFELFRDRYECGRRVLVLSDPRTKPSPGFLGWEFGITLGQVIPLIILYVSSSCRLDRLGFCEASPCAYTRRSTAVRYLVLPSLDSVQR